MQPCSPGNPARKEGRNGIAENEGGRSGSGTSGHTSTNRNRGIWRPRERTWQHDAPLWEEINKRMIEEEGGFPQEGV
jgi:hypothetical protein